LGAVLPLSGSDAQTGESLLDGLELGAKSVGPGPPVQIRVLDGEGEPGPTVRRCRELVDDPGIRAVVGGWLVPTARAMAAVAGPSGLPFVSLSPLTLPFGRATSPGVFVLHRLPALASAAARFAREDLSANVAGVVRLVDHEISRTFADAFAEGFAQLGGEVAWTISPDEYRNLALPPGPEIRVDVIYVAAPSEWALDAVFLGDKGRSAKVLTSVGWESTNLNSLVNIGTEVYVSLFFAEGEVDPTTEQFLEECRAAGVAPTPAAAFAWDAARLVRHAVAGSDGSRAGIAGALARTDPITGATGGLAPSGSSVADESPGIVSVTDQGWVPVRRVRAVAAAKSGG
jgi:branched-chain amino acid transport system substrate-binding protein